MKNSEQQAFPCINPNYDGNWNKEPINAGLTKREYFAAKAMQGILSNPSTTMERINTEDEEYIKLFERIVSKISIKIADELLNQLTQTKGE